MDYFERAPYCSSRSSSSPWKCGKASKRSFAVRRPKGFASS